MRRKPAPRSRPRRRASPPPAVRPQPLVVGIGASAGGLEALQAFFGAMPPRTGLAFVVVVHLDPTHDSLLAELLAHSTTLVVSTAEDRQPLEADHVYVIPPNRTLTLDQGLIRLYELADRRGVRGTIDRFFRSLAADQGPRAVAVVFSGIGAEGTLGARAVKAEGGLVLAQAPETASQPGMPASVIATGVVDLVRPPDKLPAALLEYAAHPHVRAASPPAEAEARSADGLPAILALVRNRTKQDFRGYRQGMLMRRVERRMALRQIGTFRDYLEFLGTHPSEVDELGHDLLIGVTSFFRDPAVFEELGTKALAEIIRRHDEDTPIRVWVPGCATGEEAYSLAIVLAEQIAAAHATCRFQIFATDIDERALEVARGGSYPESIAIDVSAERLARFFHHESHRYTIVSAIRDSVTFAVQNVVGDPPFSKLDLVSCRNLLIYLEPEVQQRLIALFHFALNAGGYLMLGSSEGVGPLDELFAPVSKRRRLFRRLGAARRLSTDVAAPHPATQPVPRGRLPLPPEPTLAASADQQLLDFLAPTAVVVRGTGQIVRFYGDVDRYVHWPAGEATLDVLTLARTGIKPALRAALHDAMRHTRRRTIEVAGVGARRGRGTLRITVRPLATAHLAERLWLIVFEEAPSAAGTRARAGARTQLLVRQLESELRTTRREQQQLVEQLEGSNEELKAANEEILSMNEELQSTNEELVTSKEELQSMNEELTTLNGQLQEKVHELTVVNDDLANLLVSTDIVTVFLDTGCRIKRFTRAAGQLLNLLPGDVGRPIRHISTNLMDEDLGALALSVMRTLEPIAREASARDGRRFLLRVLPYRTAERTVDGVLMTLVDVTALKATEGELRRAHDELEQRVASRTKWLTLMHDVTRAINDAPSWDAGLYLVLRRICEAEGWQAAFLYLPVREDPDTIVPAVSFISDGRFKPFRVAGERHRFAEGESLPGLVYKEGASRWVNGPEALAAAIPIRRDAAGAVGLQSALALPIRFGQEVMAVLELFSDQPHASDEVLLNLLNDVSAQIAKVLERERSTAQMSDLVWREQQDLLHTLHDSLGQTLTGIGMLASSLGQQMDGAAPAGETARRIAEQAQLALEEVRQLARSLFPIDIDPRSLLAALRQLASTTEMVHKIRVEVKGRVPESLRNGNVATQIYRIAQEAVTNAVKHAEATAITIRIVGESDVTRLQVADNGKGIDQQTSSGDGVGLRIMRYRANSIGGSLSVERGPGGGTIVTCTVRRRPGGTITAAG